MGDGGVTLKIDLGGVHVQGDGGLIDEARIMAGVGQLVDDKLMPVVKKMSRSLAEEKRTKLRAQGRQT